MKNILEEIKMARVKLVLDHPFFGSLVMSMKSKERTDIPTFATDGTHLYFNSEFADRLQKKEMHTVICHEILHCSNAHIFRRNGRNPERWNIACDFVINQILLDCNEHLKKSTPPRPEAFAFTGVLQGGCLIGKPWENLTATETEAFRGLSSEEVYNRLPPDIGKNSKPSFGEVMDAEGSLEQKAHQEEEWKIKVVQAAAAAKFHGTMPGALKRMIDELVNPRVPWRDQLRHFFNVQVKQDYTWRRPNRKMIHRGLYLPTLDGIKMGEIVVVIDTSGSISEAILAAFQSEMQAIMDECVPAKMTVIYCDAQVNEVEEYMPGDLLSLEATGGGGTDFAPPFEHVQEHDLNPVCMIYLTDLYGPLPQNPPDFPVLWACISKEMTASFGETIYVDI